MPPIPFKLIISQQPPSKAQGSALSIVNPVQGTSGIYQIVDSDGNLFPAYVDMATDGGYWILVARWTVALAPENQRTFNQLVVRDQAISGYSVNPTTHPAVPSGRIKANTSKEFHVRSGNPAWVSVFGEWQRMSTFVDSKQILVHNVGVPAVTSIGNKTMHGHRTGWNLNTAMSDILGFWTTAGNSGPCGGANRAGTTKCCPVVSNADGGVHYDTTTYAKQVFLRATNYRG